MMIEVYLIKKTVLYYKNPKDYFKSYKKQYVQNVNRHRAELQVQTNCDRAEFVFDTYLIEEEELKEYLAKKL